MTATLVMNWTFTITSCVGTVKAGSLFSAGSVQVSRVRARLPAPLTAYRHAVGVRRGRVRRRDVTKAVRL